MNENIIQLGELRRNKVKATRQVGQLVIEADELLNWIHTNEKHTTNQDLSCDWELVLGEFDALQTDPKYTSMRLIKIRVGIQLTGTLPKTLPDTVGLAP